MQFTRIHIKNFKSIRDMEIRDIENALILVGKNNTGKTSVLDAIRSRILPIGTEGSDMRTDSEKITRISLRSCRSFIILTRDGD